MQQEEKWDRQVRTNNTIFSLVAASIMLGLGVKEEEIPKVMGYLDDTKTAGGPQEIFLQIKTAIIAAANDFPVKAEDYDIIDIDDDE